MAKKQGPLSEQGAAPTTIDEIRNRLSTLPRKEKTVASFSKLDLITELKPTINEAREKGYSWSEIHELLGVMGVEISQFTLKAYMFEDRRAKRATKRVSAETTSTPPKRRGRPSTRDLSREKAASSKPKPSKRGRPRKEA